MQHIVTAIKDTKCTAIVNYTIIAIPPTTAKVSVIHSSEILATISGVGEDMVGVWLWARKSDICIIQHECLSNTP